MKITSCRVLAAILALVLVHFLLFSSFCLHHRQSFSRETSLPVSRKLLSSSSTSSASFFTRFGKISGSRNQNRKTVEPSLRKAPPSIPDPTQNK
uniref:CLAVATA3/ESR-related 39 n=1 Tax=Lotus japonicus TaxID=34305 RepID=A0A193PE89_LOTJA|nr:CLAVATA3/ESR-related 39 [Lotus japonicus]